MKTPTHRDSLFELLCNRLAFDEWRIDEYTMVHVKSNQQLWIGNGWISIDTYPVHAGFSFRQKWILWRAANETIARMIVAKLSTGQIVHMDEA